MSAAEIEFEAERDIDHGDEVQFAERSGERDATSGGSGTHPVPARPAVTPFNVPRRVHGGWIVQMKPRRAV